MLAWTALSALALALASTAFSMAAAPPTAESTPADAEPVSAAYASGVSFDAYAGFGVTHRHPAPLVGVGSVQYPAAVPTAGLGIALSGVPARHRALEVSGELRMMSALGSRISVETPTSTPRRPRARTLTTTVSTGATWWPRGAGHHLGLGGGLGYALHPFLIEAKIGLPSYMVHGPMVLGRVAIRAWDERLDVMVRPYVGVAVPHELGEIRITRPGVSLGALVRPSVRVYGSLHLVADVELRSARLRWGAAGSFDDHGVAATFGLMIRAPRARPRQTGTQ